MLIPYVLERGNPDGMAEGQLDVDGGLLRAYICAACGYHETYLADPKALIGVSAVIGTPCRKCLRPSLVATPLHDIYVYTEMSGTQVRYVTERAPRMLGVTGAPGPRTPVVEIRGRGCASCGHLDSYVSPTTLREHLPKLEGAIGARALPPDTPHMDSCRVCRDDEVIYLSRQLDRGFERRNMVRTIAAIRAPWWQPRLVSDIDFVGQLAACVCAACGYVESYVTGLTEIVWEKIPDMQHLESVPVADDSRGPYR